MNHEAGVIEVRLEDIIPNRFQPRISFDDNALNELAESIRQHGIIQPLVLRRLGDKYEIIAGERRYKAAGIVGLATVPAVIANVDDNTSAEVALVENIQRKDLSAIEEAISYKNLLDKDYLTQEQLAKRLGISQSAISNKLRLLNLDQEVQDALMSEKISERHARALLQLEDKEEQKKWVQRIIRERMTVRQLDLELKKLQNSGEENADVPLVNLTPNIEEIKSVATDIHPAEQPKIMEDIFGDQQAEEEEPMPPVVPEEAPKKFFNFLEDEEANLSVEEDIPTSGVFGVNPDNGFPLPIMAETSVSKPEEARMLELPISESANNLNSISPLPQDYLTETLPNIENNEQTEILDIDPISPYPMEEKPMEPIFENNPNQNDNLTSLDNVNNPLTFAEQNISQDSTFNETSISPSYEENNYKQTEIIESSPISNVLDPVNLIDTLDPEFQKQLDVAAGVDLNSIINEIRNKVRDIEDRGFRVDIDEINFDNAYQITIKIEKEE